MDKIPFDNTLAEEEDMTDPKLRFDAFMANVKDGGLRSISSITMLVCYIVANLNNKVRSETITLALSEAMLANHFEVSDAISKLIKAGTIKVSDEQTLYMEDGDLDEIELIEKDLPLTVRERSIKACQKIIAKETFKRENTADIIKTDNGYKVILSVSDNEIDFLRLELFAVSITQAEIIREKFISNPVKVYDTLIESIFNNE